MDIDPVPVHQAITDSQSHASMTDVLGAIAENRTDAELHMLLDFIDQNHLFSSKPPAQSVRLAAHRGALPQLCVNIWIIIYERTAEAPKS